MFDIKSIKSHPNKLLSVHLEGVKDNVLKLTNDKVAAMLALWHDIGKVNVNFQKAIEGKTVEWSKHSYFSAFALFCACLNERKLFEDFLKKELTKNDVLAFIVMIAKHHRDLPDFCPEGKSQFLDDKDVGKLYTNLKLFDVPLERVLQSQFSIEGLNNLIVNKDAQFKFRERIIFLPENNHEPIDFFLDTQHAFACLIHADKADAACFDGMIESQQKDVEDFSGAFSKTLNNYLSQLNQDTPLNRLRTEMRLNAISNIKQGLQENKRVFELTSPTGSGKTLMLLSLASEIVSGKGAKRIIYALPFLSITEQVEHEVSQKIFNDFQQYVQRIDSKADNTAYTKLQEEAEKGLTEEQLHQLDMVAFKEQSFSYPFIITTFVRFFETLLSNCNSELIKLPNFSNCIFLLDEIQTLPPRLYGFFVAYLTRFCEKYNSYAIISTATQPNFELPPDNVDGSGKAYKISDFFPAYQKPYSLLNLSYFQNPLFNRYIVYYRREPITLAQLAEELNRRTESILVILNTIDDTKELYRRIERNNKILLNTHFTPADRKDKIEKAKRLLKEKQPVIVVSTQLVEAGVHIDFPVVYRDMTTVASIVQSAGRCNRNGEMHDKGQVHLVSIIKDGEERAQLIYDKELLKFTKRSLENDIYEESSLLVVQQQFFNSIQRELKFGSYSSYNKKERFFLSDIKECMFNKIGQFSLIDKDVYGEEVLYYVPEKECDNSFEVLLLLNDALMELFKSKSSLDIIKNQKRKIESQLRKMQNRIVQVRLKQNDCKPTTLRSYFNLYEIALEDYSIHSGINLLGSSYF